MSVFDGHVPLLIVQEKIFCPSDKFDTIDVGELGNNTLPDPEISVQAPVPITGGVAANTEDSAQSC